MGPVMLAATTLGDPCSRARRTARVRLKGTTAERCRICCALKLLGTSGTPAAVGQRPSVPGRRPALRHPASRAGHGQPDRPAQLTVSTRSESGARPATKRAPIRQGRCRWPQRRKGELARPLAAGPARRRRKVHQVDARWPNTIPGASKIQGRLADAAARASGVRREPDQDHVETAVPAIEKQNGVTPSPGHVETAPAHRSPE